MLILIPFPINDPDPATAEFPMVLPEIVAFIVPVVPRSGEVAQIKGLDVGNDGQIVVAVGVDA